MQVIDMVDHTCVDLIPTQLNNVFQHPVSAGLPLLLVLSFIAPKLLRSKPSPPALLVAASILVLGALSLAQVAYFGLGSLSILVSIPFCVERSKLLPVFVLAGGVLGAGLLLGVAMGGMLTRSDLIEPGLIGLGPHIHGVLRFMVESLGIGVLLLPLYARAALKSRSGVIVFLVVFATGGILAAVLLHYRASGDMRKFPAASAYALSLLYVLVVDHTLSGASPGWRMLNHLGRTLLVLGGGVAAAALALPVPMKSAWDPYPSLRGAHAIAPEIRAGVRWWLERGYGNRDLIYTAKEDVTDLARSGLSVAGEDWGLRTYGVKPSIFERQRTLMQEIESGMAERALVELGVRWIFLSDEEVSRLGPEAQRALREDPRIVVIGRFESDQPGKSRRIWGLRGMHGDHQSASPE
jgi:hypothetical protein